MRRAAGLGAAALLAATLGVIAPAPVRAESQNLFNTSPITFTNTGTDASPYPSSIPVAGVEGPITDVDVVLNIVDMDDIGLLQVLVVSPAGEAEILKAGATCLGTSTDAVILTFDQQAATYYGQTYCGSGSYRPVDTCGTYCHQFDAYPGAHNPSLTNFNGENANGTWRLFVARDCGVPGSCKVGDEISAGWSLSIDTGPVDVDVPAGAGTSGPASPYPATRVVSGADVGVISDLSVTLNGIWHSHPDDLEIVLEKVDGPRIVLMSDACGGSDAAAFGWTWDDEAATAMPDEGPCTNPTYRPSAYVPGDHPPSPAPAGPYATTLSAFDGLDPRGEWRMWVADDLAGDEGFLTNRFTLTYATRPRAATAFATGSTQVSEGQTVAVAVVRSGAGTYGPGAVTVTSSAGTASSGDFIPVSGTVRFAAGQTQRAVEISVPDDGDAEGDELFTLSLSAPTGDSRLGSPSTFTVTIPANDAAGPDPDPGPQPQPDVTAPDTTVTKAPKASTRKARAKLRFVSSEDGSRFECKVDRATWKPCTSPLKLTKLKPGKHKVKVRAVDAAGNVETRPAVVRWRVVRR